MQQIIYEKGNFMRQAVYHKPEGNSPAFELEWTENGQIASLKSPKDVFRMNWTRGSKDWGTIRSDYELETEVFRSFTEENTLIETYVFRNPTDFDIFTMGTGLGIYTPFPDYYADSDTCIRECCNTHIWCGKGSSYIMALRMGGKAPHLGMVLREGSLQGYSVERMASTNGRLEELSNHRGDFILHPENLHLRPGESYTISWEFFWYQDKEDFRKKLLQTPGFILPEADSYILTGKKKISFSIHTGEKEKELSVRCNGKEIPCQTTEDGGKVTYEADSCGEYTYEIRKGEKTARTSFRVLPGLWEMAEKRCHFIAENQQCHDEKSYLNGAYLLYDTEEKQIYYEHLNDHNGGRERVGMGILMAHYLQKHPDAELEKSLDKYVRYVLRELFDEATGEVFNDAPRCRDYIRLYNYPWVSRFFLELYHLKKEERFLDNYVKSVKYFYHEGGDHFYAIGMPMYESVMTFREAGRTEEAEELLALYKKQGDFILSCGRNYPPHEVNYEQSIVAPAAIYMCELYNLTGEEKYKDEGLEQLKVLDMFQGFQPDYHMNEVAIRHWDGFWFGKRRCLGDTFPHYWSALSGYAYSQSERLDESGYFKGKADKTLKGVLSLFHEDGSASCAMVYPMSVNGVRAGFYDAWANDQDWGLYFALKYGKTE